MPYDTFHTVEDETAQLHTEGEHKKHIKQVLADALDVLADKGHHYDALRPFTHRMVFGDRSWATLIFIKADRLCSTIEADLSEENIDDCIIDLINYAIAYRAWRLMKQEEQTDEGSSYSTDELSGSRRLTPFPHGSNSSSVV